MHANHFPPPISRRALEPASPNFFWTLSFYFQKLPFRPVVTAKTIRYFEP
jgi:hypothetical protein